MALSEMRTIKIPFYAKLQGNSRSAQVVISLINGPKVDDVTFLLVPKSFITPSPTWLPQNIRSRFLTTRPSASFAEEL